MDELFERAKKQNEMDHSRILREFDRVNFLEEQRKKQVKTL